MTAAAPCGVGSGAEVGAGGASWGGGTGTWAGCRRCCLFPPEQQHPMKMKIPNPIPTLEPVESPLFFSCSSGGPSTSASSVMKIEYMEIRLKITNQNRIFI